MSRAMFVIECQRNTSHIVRGEAGLVGLRGQDPWREAIDHHALTGHGVHVYRCGDDRDDLVLAMAEVS